MSALKSVRVRLSVYKYIFMCFLSVLLYFCWCDGVGPCALCMLGLSEQTSYRIIMLLLQSTKWSYTENECVDYDRSLLILCIVSLQCYNGKTGSCQFKMARLFF